MLCLWECLVVERVGKISGESLDNFKPTSLHCFAQTVALANFAVHDSPHLVSHGSTKFFCNILCA
jgi:hypothetical protein